jgi:hypothetical protein
MSATEIDDANEELKAGEKYALFEKHHRQQLESQEYQEVCVTGETKSFYPKLLQQHNWMVYS